MHFPELLNLEAEIEKLTDAELHYLKKQSADFIF